MRMYVVKKPAQILAQNIRRLRKDKDWSQEALAERAGMSAESISRAENVVRFPQAESLEGLANALGVPLYELFMDPTDKPTSDLILADIVELINKWAIITSDEREAVMSLIRNLSGSGASNSTSQRKTDRR